MKERREETCVLGICPHDTVWSGAQPEKFGNQKKKNNKKIEIRTAIY
jgi:hypothetical protein